MLVLHGDLTIYLLNTVSITRLLRITDQIRYNVFVGSITEIPLAIVSKVPTYKENDGPPDVIPVYIRC